MLYYYYYHHHYYYMYCIVLRSGTVQYSTVQYKTRRRCGAGAAADRQMPEIFRAGAFRYCNELYVLVQYSTVDGCLLTIITPLYTHHSHAPTTIINTRQQCLEAARRMRSCRTPTLPPIEAQS